MTENELVNLFNFNQNERVADSLAADAPGAEVIWSGLTRCPSRSQ